MTLIAVVMHAKQKIGRYTNAIPMLDYGFQHYYTMKLMDRGQSTGRVRVRYGHHTWVRTETSQAVYATLPKQVSKDLATTKVTLKKGLNAPLRKGTRVGTVKVYENGKQTGSAAIVSADTVAKGGPWSALYIADWVFVTICIVVAVLFVLWILFLIRRADQIGRASCRERV